MFLYCVGQLTYFNLLIAVYKHRQKFRIAADRLGLMVINQINSSRKHCDEKNYESDLNQDNSNLESLMHQARATKI